MSASEIWNGSSLAGKKRRLDTLTSVIKLLGAEDVSFASITSQIDALSDELLSLQLSNNRLAFIEEELNSNLGIVMHELQQALKWKESLEAELATSESAVSLERKREALVRRGKELYRELQQITERSDQPTITITQLLKQREKISKKEDQLKIKRIKLEAFQGLPPNLELARHELAQAQEERMKLTRLRERLLRSMADNIS